MRLLVADVDGARRDALETLDRRMRITRLGQGVDATAAAPRRDRAHARGAREYRGAIDELGVERVRADRHERGRATRRTATTSSTRRGACSALRPELLRGDEEARLAFLGATAGLGEPAPYLVVDIGGGSTEFVVGTDEPEALISIDIGCVRITEQYLHSDPPRPRSCGRRCRWCATTSPTSSARSRASRDAKTLVGLAGTVTTSPRSSSARPSTTATGSTTSGSTRAAVEDVFRTLATESVEERRHNPGLEPGRVDVIVGGAIVLVAVMRHSGFDELLVSEADILDGLARDRLTAIRGPA